MNATDKLIKANKKYYKANPDAGFSVERNKQVIADTIKTYEANRAKRRKEYTEQVDERSDAIATYFEHLNKGKNTPLMQYFGRRELARLQGKKFYEKMSNGRIKFEEVN